MAKLSDVLGSNMGLAGMGLAGGELSPSSFTSDTSYVWIVSSSNSQNISSTRGIWVDTSTWIDLNLWYD